MDVQPTAPQFCNVIGVPDILQYPVSLPFPLKSKTLSGWQERSYDSLPHGSARVIPVGMATGEAAVLPSAYSVKNQVGYKG